MDMILIGNRLRLARKRLHLRQIDVAARAHLSTNYISILECGKKEPSLETFIALCNALETSADEILWDHLTERHRIQATQLAEYIGNMPKEKQEELFRVVDVIVDLP